MVTRPHQTLNWSNDGHVSTRGEKVELVNINRINNTDPTYILSVNTDLMTLSKRPSAPESPIARPP